MLTVANNSLVTTAQRVTGWESFHCEIVGIPPYASGQKCKLKTSQGLIIMINNIVDEWLPHARCKSKSVIAPRALDSWQGAFSSPNRFEFDHLSSNQSNHPKWHSA